MRGDECKERGFAGGVRGAIRFRSISKYGNELRQLASERRFIAYLRGSGHFLLNIIRTIIVMIPMIRNAVTTKGQKRGNSKRTISAANINSLYAKKNFTGWIAPGACGTALTFAPPAVALCVSPAPYTYCAGGSGGCARLAPSRGPTSRRRGPSRRSACRWSAPGRRRGRAVRPAHA